MPLNNDIIPIGSNSQVSDVKAIIRQFKAAYSTLGYVKAYLDNMTDGVVYTRIETHFGLAIGEGEAFYNLVAGSLSELDNDANFQAMLGRILD